MLKKALNTSTLSLIVAIALTGSGSGPVSANSAVDQTQRASAAVDCGSGGYASDAGDEVREEFHQTYPLAATGRVSVENLNGGVQIKVWDRAAVQVDAIKHAYRRERLTEAKIDVNSSEENIRIKTDYPDQNQTFTSDERGRYENPAIVDYILTVPRQAVLESIELVNGSIDIDGAEGSVKASSINGRVTARGLLVEAKLSTINGPLHATFTRLDETKPISLQSINGPVTLVIPSDSNAMVRASTVHGGISNDFGLLVKDGEYVGHDLAGQIGTGGPRIKLGNVNGPIRITHSQDGRKVSSATSMELDKEKIKKRIKSETAEAISESVAEEVAAATASTVAEQTRQALDSARVTREAQREAQREVEAALREAQREVERAQQEVQREVERQAREEVRVARAGRAAGTGAGTGRGTGVGIGSNAGRFTLQETKSFSVSGAPRVNIGTFDGAVTVHGWNKSEVTYTATKRADDEDELKGISIRTEQQGSTVSVIASSEEDNGSAQLEVYVPRRSTLHVSSDDGSLKLDGVSGDITLRTGDGTIEVNGGGGQLQVNTGDGRVRVTDFEGQVDARTGDGPISLDGNFNALSARTGDGSISLTVPSGSNFTIETNADDTISNEGLTMTEDIAPSKRVKRWKIGSGGKVFVLNTGEGKIVLHSR